MANPAQANAPEIKNAAHETDPNKKSAPPEIYTYNLARQLRAQQQSAESHHAGQEPPVELAPAPKVIPKIGGALKHGK